MKFVCNGIGLLILGAALGSHACGLRANGDGTMTDPSSGLLIRSCAEGENWSGSSCAGVSTGYNWKTAMQNFSTGAWRLMTKEEADQIAPNSKTCWAVTGGAWNASWTSSPDPSNDIAAYIAVFKFGLVGRSPRDSKEDVRLVSSLGNRGAGASLDADDPKSVGRGAKGM